MIEIKNLKKVYKTEGLEPVTALNGISIKFPEKGLVFLLGRSGSGKSTMLNLIGGLDSADEGEIIVKGRSSKDFTPADFDSYRNTYVGFIFQDFNILEEFTIAENIALALELQGKEVSDEKVNELLELVDLGGLGDRKPNTLSGGQRQRVAIARALIKNPELIMADEPTGALDSKTGHQILDTLQKLSKEKLVLVVSHDREAAEKYADRIIEIADGEIILDKTKEVVLAETISENVGVLGGDVITIKNGKNMTDKEVAEVVKIIKQSDGESVITLGKKDVPEVKRVCRINEERRETFRETKDDDVKEFKGEKPQLIQSKLPTKQALKMGLSGLKAKPFRFIFTVFLSVMAFCVFGVFSTLMLFDANYSLSKALEEKGYQSVTIDKYYDYISRKVLVHTDGTESIELETQLDKNAMYSQEELDELNAKGRDSYAGIFTLSGNYPNPSVKEHPITIKDLTLQNYSENGKYFSFRSLQGFTDCGPEYMENNGFELLAGHYPTEEEPDAVAIPEYLYELYKYCGQAYKVGSKTAYLEPQEFVDADKKLALNVSSIGPVTLKIVGIYRVSDLSKFEIIKTINENNLSNAERQALADQLSAILFNSFDSLAYVSNSFYQTHKDLIPVASVQIKSIKGTGLYMNTKPATGDFGAGSQEFFADTTYEYNKSRFSVYNVKGEKIEYQPNNEQIYVHKNTFVKLLQGVGGTLDNITEENATALSNVIYYVRNIDNKETQLKLAGYYELTNGGSNGGTPYLVTTDFMYSFANIAEYNVTRTVTDYVEVDNPKYNYIISNTDTSLGQVKRMLEERDGARFCMRNVDYDVLFNGEIISTVKQLQAIFLVGGLVMGVFAALMLLNFISSSIDAKRKEIGILRAVGAGKSDVFRIFFTESLLLAVICFVLACALAFVGTIILNNELAKIFYTQLLSFGVVNVILIFVISMFISFTATLFPVIKESKKSPVESIRAL